MNFNLCTSRCYQSLFSLKIPAASARIIDTGHLTEPWSWANETRTSNYESSVWN